MSRWERSIFVSFEPSRPGNEPLTTTLTTTLIRAPARTAVLPAMQTTAGVMQTEPRARQWTVIDS